MHIYHIVLPENWDGFKNGDRYAAESLETEGFIHCSFIGQLEGVIARYYSGAERILVLHIDPEKLTSELKNEPSTNNEIYPHIYGTINRDAVVRVEEKILK